MLKPYDYIFYKLYLFFRIIDEDMPKFLSIMAMCWLMLFNFLNILNIVISIEPQLGYSFNKIIGAFIGIAIFLVHYLYFSWKNKYIMIINRFEKESGTKSIIGTLGTLAYVGISAGVCILYRAPNIYNIYWG